MSPLWQGIKTMKKMLVIATFLLATAAQAQVPRQPQDFKEWNDIMNKWNDMINACATVPNANTAALGLPNKYNGGGPRLDVLRQVLPRIEGQLEFCLKRKREIAEQKRENAEQGAKREADRQRGIAEAKANKEAETKKSLDELLQKRDPSDMVEQILNYTFTGKEQGLEGEDGHFGGSYYYPQWKFFIKEKNCFYRYIVFMRVDGELRKIDAGFIDVNKYDPHLFDFKERQERNDDGNLVTKYETLYDGKALASTLWPLSLERARRGWSLVYSKYCTGSQAPF
jgi:hypothetical protein